MFIYDDKVKALDPNKSRTAIMSKLSNSNHRESDLARKEENKNSVKNSTKPNLSTSSWTKLKDPRIVRVSRAFGGKDRHSKVCTVKGLKDRRVRLSVPTAIQLYDLQYRLGLDQPSKVVDWLLDVAKHEIDELPPLQMPSSFAQDLHSMIDVGSQSETIEGVKTNGNGINWEDYGNPNKSKEKDTFFVQSSDQSSSIPIMFNNVVPNGSFLNLNPSNLSLSRFGSAYRSMSSHQQEDASHNFNINMSGSHLLVYPPPSHDHNSRYLQFDPKQLNFELLSSSSSSSHNPLASSPLYAINQGMIGPFHLSMNPSEENEQDKGN
ncbi:hypothetical protein L1987_65959 [Smallanthus sonchifolius]|uniref:Uncharacterized protein n=1 Tax=Smallanthus sonchifolius TaxID=185202 RepID=A0ACB9BW01_9ASTR|nr:hypothetical protein L1987_65959 [Smallanthus sonchifolius]